MTGYRVRVRNLRARLKAEICRSPKNSAQRSGKTQADKFLSDFFAERKVRRPLTDIDAALKAIRRRQATKKSFLLLVTGSDRDSANGARFYNESAADSANRDGMGAAGPGSTFIRAQNRFAFFIDHGPALSLQTSEIGSRVKHHSVTLGAQLSKDGHGKIKKGGKRHPTVEDEYNLSGSTILGAKP